MPAAWKFAQPADAATVNQHPVWHRVPRPAVQTDGMQVLHYWRTDAQAAEGDNWIVQVASGPDAELELSALDMRLALADIYAGTDIPPEPPPPRRPR